MVHDKMYGAHPKGYVVLLNVMLLNVVLPNLVLPYVVLLNAVLPNVVRPKCGALKCVALGYGASKCGATKCSGYIRCSTMKSWLESAGGMEGESLSCMLAEPREALLPITGRENLAPRKRDRCTMEPCAITEEAYLSSGTGSPCAGLSREERRRRRRATLKYRTAHATRERIRVEAFNAAFGSLRRLLPTLPPDKKLSKIEILRLAICYIAYLNHVLDA